jgi:hypothetical protein
MTVGLFDSVACLDVSLEVVFSLVVLVACTDEQTTFISTRVLLVAHQVFLGRAGLRACCACKAPCGDMPTARYGMFINPHLADWNILRCEVDTLRA